MRTASRVFLAVVLISGVAAGQLKSKNDPKQNVSESLVRPDDGGWLLGWFDPSRLTMHQSYSLSYSTFGGQSMSLGMYTNSMFYRISDPLSVQFDISLMHSPFNTIGDRFSKDVSGLYLTRAQLNYKLSPNMFFQLQYRQLPAMYWMNMYPNTNFSAGFDRGDQEDKH